MLALVVCQTKEVPEEVRIFDFFRVRTTMPAASRSSATAMEDFELRCELTTSHFGFPARGDGWPEDLLVGERMNTLMGGKYPVRIDGRRAALRYSSDVLKALDDGYELLRALRGALGLHFGQPVEVTNVAIVRCADGAALDTIAKGSWSIGWGDVTEEEVAKALTFLGELDPLGRYALALDYFNQGRLMLGRNGTPEAAVVYFYKVLEALMPPKKKPEDRNRQWKAGGFSEEEITRLEVLYMYRNEWDAAHAARGKDRVRLSHAHEAEDTARLILMRLAGSSGLSPQPPKARVTYRH